MKKKSNILLRILITLALVGLFSIGVMFIFGLGPFMPEDEDMSADVKIVTENYKTEIIIYGDEIPFDEACYVRYIDKITKENLTSDDSFVYTVLVINDLNGNVELTDENMENIHSYVYDDKKDFFYLGKDDVDKIVQADIFHHELNGKNMSLGVVYEGGFNTEVLGTWDVVLNDIYLTKNEMLLSECLLGAIVSKIRIDNK